MHMLRLVKHVLFVWKIMPFCKVHSLTGISKWRSQDATERPLDTKSICAHNEGIPNKWSNFLSHSHTRNEDLVGAIRHSETKLFLGHVYISKAYYSLCMESFAIL